MRFLLAGILLLCSCPPTAAAEGRKPAAAAVSTVIATALPPSAAAIQIDGELSEAVWATVPPVSGFVQRDPTEGAPATFDTEVRVACRRHGALRRGACRLRRHAHLAAD